MLNSSSTVESFAISRASRLLGQLTQSKWLLSIATSLIPEVSYFFDTDEAIIALTIDDGPDSTTTPKILDILAKYGVQATFFVISSKFEANEKLVRDIINGGHELGNHLTEDKPSISLTPEEFECELLKAHATLSNFTKPYWLRPAFGWYTPSMVSTARKHNYQIVLGSVFPFDTFIPSSEFASSYILSNAFNGSIIVLHDSGFWGERTAITLNKVLPQLLEKGYRVVTLSELFGINKKHSKTIK